ncbi:TonB-dependent receptor [Novosphingobium sp. FSY-8]|uniref:TonB-dependent receptor n=2 Tax=Novosphingobium ovatum TaxID=1908523 RepID=A0ABW9XA44_9SPHN|nr:TonB-dependent receptor [Novosphingobium ovatum]
MATPAMAQQAPAADAGGELVVTARRVNERLTDVPASVSVLTEATLTKAGVTKTDDFVKLTPGVTVVSGTSEAGDVQINIRGVNGARDAEGSVALVVDGILKTNTASLGQGQGLLTQVEILKGPQGAIYGRNATAGAIIIQTRKPTDVLTGGLKMSYASQNTAKGEAYLAGPLSDSVGFVVSGDYSTTDGFYRNAYLGNAKLVDYQHSWNLSGRLVADLGSSTTLDAKAHFGRLKGASLAFNAAFNLPGFAAFTGISTFNENVNDHPMKFYNNIVPVNEQKTLELSAKLTHDMDFATLTAWVAYNDIRNWLMADGTSADFQLFTSYTNSAVASVASTCAASVTSLAGYPMASPTYIAGTAAGSLFGPYSPTTCDGSQYQRREQKDISTEIRLASKPGGPLSWQAGLYFTHIDRRAVVASQADKGLGGLASAYNAPTSSSPTNQLFDDFFKTNAYAAFASGDYNVTSALTGSVALRYDVEDRSVRNNVPLLLDPFSGHCLNPGQGLGSTCTAITPKSRTFQMFEPKLSLRYRFGPEATVYGTWGVGYKSGGFNNQGAAAIVASYFGAIGSEARIEDIYKAERSSSFEVGVKGRLGKVDYTLAAYHNTIRNMQFFEFYVGAFGLLRVVESIDKVELKGLEASLNWRAAPGLTLSASGNLLDSKIKANSVRPSTVGNKSPYSADYTLNLGAQYEAPISSKLTGLLRVDYRLTGPTWFHVVQAQDNPTIFGVAGNYAGTQRKAYGLVDIRAGVSGNGWSATLFGTNVLDKQYLAEVIPAVEFGGSFISPGTRAQYGIEVSLKF